MMNNSSSCDLSQDMEILEIGDQFEFKPYMIMIPVSCVLNGYQLTKLYKKYKNDLTAIDIFELNCLGDRTLVFIVLFILKLGIIKIHQICFALKFLLMTLQASFQADFVISQLESYWFIKLKSEYPTDSRSVTASKISHGTKLGATVLTILLSYLTPDWFTCRELNHLGVEKLVFIGIQSLITASVNIAVSAYISYKMITKEQPEEDMSSSIFEVRTVSKAIQNQDYLHLEDIEDYNDSEQQVASNGSIPNDVDRPNPIEDLSTGRVETKSKTEIKRLTSKADMFYRIPVENNQPDTVSCFPALSLETLKTILKFNLMTMCTVTMLLSGNIVSLYIILTNSCISDLGTTLLMSKVLQVVSVSLFPFLTQWKLNLIREQGLC